MTYLITTLAIIVIWVGIGTQVEKSRWHNYLTSHPTHHVTFQQWTKEYRS